MLRSGVIVFVPIAIIISIARQQEIVAEEEKNKYVELAHLAMLLGFPGAMIDEGMASLVNKKTGSEVRHTNVSCFFHTFLPTINSFFSKPQLVNLTSDSQETTDESQEGQ